MWHVIADDPADTVIAQHRRPIEHHTSADYAEGQSPQDHLQPPESLLL